MHGGANGIGAPRGNRNALKHGRYTAEGIARHREVAALLRACRDQLGSMRGKSSFTMYRKDLFDKAGLKMPEDPTWEFIMRICSQTGRAGRCWPGCYFEVNEG